MTSLPDWPQLPEMKVEIAFSENPLGDDPENDAQVWIGGVTPGVPTGWTDVTAYTREVSIDRGRTSDLEKVSSGTASVVLDNRDRRFDPINEDSPYWADPTGVQRTNLLRNPSFDYGIGNWVGNNCTLAWNTTAQFRMHGAGSLRVTNTALLSTVCASNYSTINGTATSRTPVTAGQTYQFTGKTRLTATVGGTTMAFEPQIRWFNAAGTIISSASGTTVSVGQEIYWRFFSASGTAPVGAVTAVPAFEVTTAITNIISVDDCLFEKAGSGEYFDGSFPGARWSGTPGDSTSVLYTTAVNYCKNPALNASDNGWGGAPYSTTSRVVNPTDASGWAMLMDRTAPGGIDYLSVGPDIEIVSNQTYAFSILGRSDLYDSPVSLYIEYYQADNTLVTTQTVSLGTLEPGLWKTLSGTFGISNLTPFVGVVTARPQLRITYSSSSTLENMWFTKAMVYPNYYFQPYVDGDQTGYNWLGARSNAASEGTIRTTGETFLKPRRQIQIHGVYPNDSIADGICYDRVTLEGLQPGTNTFNRQGLLLNAANSCVFTSTQNIVGQIPGSPGTNTYAEFWTMVTPSQKTRWGTMDCCLFMIDDSFAAVLYGDQLELWSYTIDWLPEISVTLNASDGFYDRQTMWIGVVIYQLGQYRYFEVYTAPYQPYAPISEWTTLHTFADYEGYFATYPSLQTDEIRFAPPNSVATYFPRTTGYTTEFIAGRFTVWNFDLNIAVWERTCDLLMDTHHTLFRGYTSGWRQNYANNGKDATVPLECFDSLGILGNMKIPVDFVTEYAKSKNAWGYWKLGDAGGVAVDYSGNANDLIYQDGGRLPSAYGPLTPGLSGLSTEFIDNVNYTPLIHNLGAGGNVYPYTSGAEHTVAFWFRSDKSATQNKENPMFMMAENPSTVNGGATTNLSLEIGLWNPLPQPRAAWLYFTARNPFTGMTVRFEPSLSGYIDDGIPHHVVIAVEKINTVSFVYHYYLDGVQVFTGVATGVSHGGYIAIGGRFDAGISASRELFKGEMQDVLYIPGVCLDADEVAELYDLSNGYLPETVSERMNRLADYASYPDYLRAIDSNIYGDCGILPVQDGKSILESMQEVEDTEAGILFASRLGQLALRGRYFLSMNDQGVNPMLYMSDDGLEIGYQNLSFNLDADELVNDHVVLDDAEQPHQSDDIVSIEDYGRRSRTVRTLLPSSEDAAQMSIGLTNIYKKPILRAEPFDLTPTGFDWMYVLPIDIGVRMRLTATPMGVGDPIVQDLALQAISYQMRPKDWKVTITGSPRPVISYFVLDRSALDGPDVLGF